MGAKGRVFSPEFRVAVARRICAGESISQLHHELGIKRSVLYRWRDAYRKDGEDGLKKPAGRPPGFSNPSKPGSSEAEQLRQRVAQLEQKVGQQTLLLDFFRGAFKRVKESSQPSGGAGETASTKRQGS